MARVNPISDGQPLTYELLNQIINAVNDIKIEQEDVKRSIIDVLAPTIKGADDEIIKIRCGTLELDFSKGEAGAKTSVTWGDKVNFSEKPYILVTLEDPTVSAKEHLLPVSVLYNVTKNGFSIRAKRVTANPNTTSADQIIVNYMAIGPSAE